MSAGVEIKELYHSFGKKTVLDGIELKIEEGEIFGLLGPSGAGKTTLINILTGQLKPKSGKANILGKEVGSLKGGDFRKIGIMMDHFGLYERMNCYDNLKFYEMLDDKSEVPISDLLKYVGLDDASKTNVSDLSKGMRNRLSFARVLLRSPQIMFLDVNYKRIRPGNHGKYTRIDFAGKEEGNYDFSHHP